MLFCLYVIGRLCAGRFGLIVPCLRVFSSGPFFGCYLTVEICRLYRRALQRWRRGYVADKLIAGLFARFENV